jgi:hypothetical protein
MVALPTRRAPPTAKQLDDFEERQIRSAEQARDRVRCSPERGLRHRTISARLLAARSLLHANHHSCRSPISVSSRRARGSTTDVVPTRRWQYRCGGITARRANALFAGVEQSRHRRYPIAASAALKRSEAIPCCAHATDNQLARLARNDRRDRRDRDRASEIRAAPTVGDAFPP